MPAIIPSNSLNYQALLEHEFSLYLIAQHLSVATQKNYRTDVRHFFAWLASFKPKQSLVNSQQKPDLTFITPDTIHEYIQSLKQTDTPLATVNRRLSSLRLFFQCATLQAWCTTSPLLGIPNLPGEEKRPLSFNAVFDAYLASEGTAEKTRKNYRTDIQLFIQWLKKELSDIQIPDSDHEEAILLPQTTFDAVKRYKLMLLTSHTPISTINRRLSAIRKLFQFAQAQQWISHDPTLGIHNCKEDVFGALEKTLDQALFAYTKTNPLNQQDTSDIKTFFYWLESSQTCP